MFVKLKSTWVLLAVLGLYFGGVAVYGASSIFITTEGSGIDTLTDLSGGNLDRTIAIFELNSTVLESPDGFLLHLSSENGGNLVREVSSGVYASSALAGNVANYTFSLISNASGSLGCDQPTLPTVHTFSTDITLNFNQNVVADTVDKQYEFVVTVPENTKLLSGSFKDVVTVTVSDL